MHSVKVFLASTVVSFASMAVPFSAFAADSINKAIAAHSGSQYSPVATQKLVSNRATRSPLGRKFIGRWYARIQKRVDTCGGVTASSLNVGIGIDGNLVGTDLGDRSPLFAGRVSGDSIIFGRKRNSSPTCVIHQAVQINSKNGITGTLSLGSELVCSTGSCRTLYQGSARRQ